MENDEGSLGRLRTFFSSGIAHQSLVVSAALLFSGTLGATLGYSAVLLPQLQSNTSSIPTNEDMGSWIASLQSGVSPLGTVLGGVVMDKWGRRFALRGGVLPIFVGYLILCFARSHILILIARFVTGIAGGFAAAASQIIVSEIATPRLRGVFASSIYTTYSAGILLVYLLGSYLHWKTVAAILSLLPMCSFIALLFVPETPIWLAKKERIEEAEMALRWLRGNEKEAKLELKELLSITRAQQELEETESEMSDEEESAVSSRQMQTIANQVRVLLAPSILKPFLIAQIICWFQILSGTILIIFYAVDLIAETNQDGEGFDNFTVAQLTAVIRLIFVLVTNSLFYFVNRRIHAIASSGICALSAVILGIFLYCQSRENYSLSPIVNTWLTAVLILIFIAASTSAFLPLPTTVMSEILPIKIRGAACGYIFAVNDITQFLLAKSYPWMKDTLGAHGIFLVFGANSLIFSAFCFLFLPETRGKSLAQIEEYFRGQNVFWVKRDRRLGRDYTRKRYFEMKKINTATKEPEPQIPEEDVEKPKREKRKVSVTFAVNEKQDIPDNDNINQ